MIVSFVHFFFVLFSWFLKLGFAASRTSGVMVLSIKTRGALLLAACFCDSAADPFPCSVVQPVKDEPATVSDVHPAHVSVVMAMGDSMTAGFAARGFFGAEEGVDADEGVGADKRVGDDEGVGAARGAALDAPLEFRALSFSGGAGSDGYWTMPYFLGQYNSSLTGFSTKRTVPQTPGTGYLAEGANHLNAALSNAHAHQLEMQVDELKSQSSSIPDFNARWKVLTVFIGANDICDGFHGFEACDGSTRNRTLLVNRYETNLRKTLESIRDSFGRVIVQVVSLFRFGSLKQARAGHSWCGIRRNLLVECNCLDTSLSGGSGPVDDAQLDELDTTVSAFNDRIETLAAEFNLQRPDFAVVAVTTGKNQDIPDITYVSELDCFHPSALAHATLARSLWNSMFDLSRAPKPINASVPLFCPTASSTIYVGDPTPSSPAHAAVSVV